MSRFKGIECDQCGMPLNRSLHLKMSVEEVFAHRPKGQRQLDNIDNVEFYADFCSRECMRVFLNRVYFESKLEVIEDE